MRVLRARLLAGRAGAGRRRGRRRPPLAGPHRRPLRAGPHLQLPGEPDQRPPGRLQGLQPRPGARRRARRRHRRADPGRHRGAARRHREPAADPARGSPAPDCTGRGRSVDRRDPAAASASSRRRRRRAAARPRARRARGVGCCSPRRRAPTQSARVRRARRRAGRARAAAAPHRQRAVPPPRARGRPGRVRPAARRPSCSSTPSLADAARRCGPSSISCAGSGALALAVAHERPGRARHRRRAVDPAALAWLRRNAAGTGVPWSSGDVRDRRAAAPTSRGSVDVVVSNPPYVPATTGGRRRGARRPGRRPSSPGTTGSTLIPRVVALRGRALLRPGGLLVDGARRDARGARCRRCCAADGRVDEVASSTTT